MDYRKKIVVSIGLPTYNRAALLSRAIESILAQTFPYFELIIVDDGSTDHTKEVVALHNDPRIRVVRHQENKGLMVSRNTAVRASQGDYLAFQDSDDWWHPSFLEETVALLTDEPPHTGAAYARVKKTYLDGRVTVIPLYNARLTSGDLLEVFLSGEWLITLQALVMRREYLEKVGMFDEAFRVFGDAEFLIRLASQGKFAFNPEVRVYLEAQEDSISRRKKQRLYAREYLFQKHKDLFVRYPAARRRFIYELARAFAVRREWKKAIIYGTKSIWIP
jgi:glycosyltransferase involved in cell wall biosynthesis